MPRPGFEPGSSARKAGILDLAIRPGLAYYIQFKDYPHFKFSCKLYILWIEGDQNP